MNIVRFSKRDVFQYLQIQLSRGLPTFCCSSAGRQGAILIIMKSGFRNHTNVCIFYWSQSRITLALYFHFYDHLQITMPAIDIDNEKQRISFLQRRSLHRNKDRNLCYFYKTSKAKGGKRHGCVDTN